MQGSQAKGLRAANNIQISLSDPHTLNEWGTNYLLIANFVVLLNMGGTKELFLLANT